MGSGVPVVSERVVVVADVCGVVIRVSMLESSFGEGLPTIGAYVCSFRDTGDGYDSKFMLKSRDRGVLDANRMGGVVEGGNGVAMEGFTGIGVYVGESDAGGPLKGC